MAYNFPNSPTIGEEFEHYMWDGEKWTISGEALPPEGNPPFITSSPTLFVSEGSILTHTMTANSGVIGNPAIVWTKTGGADSAAFSLSGATLTLPAKDYDTDQHAWVVQITATNVEGLSVSQTVTVNIIELGIILPPTITLAPGSDTGTPGDNITVDTTPDIDIVPGTPFIIGDVITLEVDDNAGFSTPVAINNTLDSGEVLTGTITETIPSLAIGIWYYRAKHSRGPGVSGWSSTLQIEIVGEVEPPSEAEWFPNSVALANNEAFNSNTSTFNLTITTVATDTLLVTVSSSNRAISALAINGAPMARAVRSGSGDNTTEIWFIFGAFTNPTLVVTSTGFNFGLVGVTYGKWTGNYAVPDSTDAAVTFGFYADPLILPSLTIPDEGMLLAASGASNAMTWNNATQDAQINDPFNHSSAHSITPGPLAVSISGNSFAGNAAVAITIQAADTTIPQIISSDELSSPENAPLNHSLVADEPGVTWTKVGGADQAAFTLVGNSLTMAPQNFEDGPTRVVEVRATDLAGNQSAIQEITVTLSDVAEGTTLSDITWVSSYGMDGTPAPGTEQTGLAFGPASADRVLVVFVAAVGAGDSDNMLWGVKIDDVTATQALRVRNGGAAFGIHFLNVPAGTTGKVELDGYTNGWLVRYVAMIGYMTGSGAATVHSLTPSTTYFPNGNLSATVTVPVNCVAALVGWINGEVPATYSTTWTNATELDDEAVGGVFGVSGSCAFTKTTASVSFTVAPASNTWGWGGVVFQP
jgi:hypothetical protein